MTGPSALWSTGRSCVPATWWMPTHLSALLSLGLDRLERICRHPEGTQWSAGPRAAHLPMPPRLTVNQSRCGLVDIIVALGQHRAAGWGVGKAGSRSMPSHHGHGASVCTPLGLPASPQPAEAIRMPTDLISSSLAPVASRIAAMIFAGGAGGALTVLGGAMLCEETKRAACGERKCGGCLSSEPCL